jgi:DivIVA domain-containing protein
MGVDQTSLDRIRNATFPAARRGYDKHEVEKFLARLADWLETGGGDESRSDAVKRELERVGQRTGAILAQAEESAQQIRAEAEEEAQEELRGVTAEAEKIRAEAEAYVGKARGDADEYAEKTRQAAEQEATALRDEAEEDARQTVEEAQAQARRIVDEGAQRREDLEAVITDLVRRRDEVLADTDELIAKLSSAIGQHRHEEGADPFDTPEELDPLAREGEPEAETEAEPEAEAKAEPEGDSDDEAADEPETEEKKQPTEQKPRGKSKSKSRKVKA